MRLYSLWFVALLGTSEGLLFAACAGGEDAGAASGTADAAAAPDSATPLPVTDGSAPTPDGSTPPQDAGPDAPGVTVVLPPNGGVVAVVNGVASIWDAEPTASRQPSVPYYGLHASKTATADGGLDAGADNNDTIQFWIFAGPDGGMGTQTCLGNTRGTSMTLKQGPSADDQYTANLASGDCHITVTNYPTAPGDRLQGTFTATMNALTSAKQLSVVSGKFDVPSVD